MYHREGASAAWSHDGGGRPIDQPGPRVRVGVRDRVRVGFRFRFRVIRFGIRFRVRVGVSVRFRVLVSPSWHQATPAPSR